VNLHIYRAVGQPMVRYNAMLAIDEPLWIECSPFKRYQCDTCWRMRAAKNLSIQVYYDMSLIFCTEPCEPIKYKEKRRIWARQAYQEKKRLQASDRDEHV